MAVAYSQTQPRFFWRYEATKHSASITNHTSVVSSNDSDDDYDYVATLAEQIAHSMLDDDDDDCQDDTSSIEQHVFGSRSLSRKHVSSKSDAQDTAHDFSCIYPDLSRRISESSHPVSVPFNHHSSTFLNRRHGNAQAECNCSGLALASSHGEAGALYVPLEVGERHCSERERPAYVSRQSNVAACPTVTESFNSAMVAVPVVEGTEITVNATKFPGLQANSDGLLHRSRNHGSLEWQYRGWPRSNGRSRNKAGRRHRISRDDKGACAHGSYNSVQPSRGTSLLQSVPPEVPDRTIVHPSVLGHDPSRKGTTGTGVFLPRTKSPSSTHWRKSEGGTTTTKAGQALKNVLENANENNYRYGGEYVRKSNFRTELIERSMPL